MSDYNNDSNDDLPNENAGGEGAPLQDDQYVDGQYVEEQFAEGEYVEEQYPEGQNLEQQYTEPQYVEEQHAQEEVIEGQYAEEAYVETDNSQTYAEPENNYYTSDYQKQDYYQNDTDSTTYEQVEPNIFVDQSSQNYSENTDVYSTELPSYEPRQEQEVQQVDGEGYVAADAYLEPNSYADQGYNESNYTETNYSEPDYANAPEFSDTYATQGGVAQNYVPSSQSGQVDDQGLNHSTYNNAGYGQAAYDNIDAQGVVYDDQGRSTQYDSPLQVNPTYADSGQPMVERGRVEAISTAQPEHLPADFRQEYIGEPPVKSTFSSGMVAVGIILLMAFGAGGYFLYSNFSGSTLNGDIPVILADKTSIKTFPSGETGNASAENGTKSTDRLPIGGVVTADGKTSNPVQPALLDSREEVVEQSIKSEDRIETVGNVTADNEDKDIQNVLTLIKTGANNVEILLKPEDVNQLDQNQISIDGLETTLVAAKSVKLTDLIAQANQSNGAALEKIKIANVDDLPVVAVGDQNPFEDVIANAAAASGSIQLPETQPLPLPEGDTLENVNIASNDVNGAVQTNGSDQVAEVVNIVASAPKPISRPALPTNTQIADTVVANSLPPAVAAASGSYGVQLASLPSESAARQAYARFLAQFPSILAGFSPIIQEANIPGTGTVFRVITGPIINRSDANQLCANLRSAGLGDCFAKKL